MFGKLTKILVAVALVALFVPLIHAYHGVTAHQDTATEAIRASGVPFTPEDTNDIVMGSLHEDDGGWASANPRYRHHHYNPITRECVDVPVLFDDELTALARASNLWDDMAARFAAADRNGYVLTGEWNTGGGMHYLGRVSHMLHDMASPPHAHAPRGHGSWVNEYNSDFEDYWTGVSMTVSGIRTPLDDVPPTPSWNSKMDPIDWNMMRNRIGSSRSNVISDYVDVMALITYHHSSFWGQISASTSDPIANSSDPLSRMFYGKMNYDSFWNSWEIDGIGYYERELVVDAWWPCGGDSFVNPDKSAWGYFYIYITHNSGNARPNNWPNGDANTDNKTLTQYYGEVLLPIVTRYNRGLLNLAWNTYCAPDLYDDGEAYRSFSPQTVTRGETAFTVSTDVRNGGMSDSGAFYVDFYASSDTTISATDEFVGRVLMSSGVAAGDWETATWSGTFPSSVPAGTYWVGWIIDADNDVAESDETNNKAYKTGYQLLVENPTTPDTVSWSPASHNFATVTVGSSSDYTFSLDHSGSGSVSGTISVSGTGFSIVSGGGAYTLSGGGSRSVVVRFAPSSSGAKSGTLGATGGGDPPASLSGTGQDVGAVTWSPTSYDFGRVTVGSSQDLTFSLDHNGGTSVSGTISASGTDFSIVSGGGAYTLSGAASRSVTVRFAPTSDGAKTGTLSATGGGDPTAGLSGEGQLPPGVVTWSPTSHDFGTLTVGSSQDFTFSLDHNGDAAVSGTITVSGSHFSIVSGGGAYTLSGGGSRSVVVRFAPTSSGAKSGTLSATGGGNPTVSLSGTGDNPPSSNGGGCLPSGSATAFAWLLPLACAAGALRRRRVSS